MVRELEAAPGSVGERTVALMDGMRAEWRAEFAKTDVWRTAHELEGRQADLEGELRALRERLEAQEAHMSSLEAAWEVEQVNPKP